MKYLLAAGCVWVRLLGDHMARKASERLLGAMVLDRFDSQEWGLL